jgi:hypothetical protein
MYFVKELNLLKFIAKYLIIKFNIKYYSSDRWMFEWLKCLNMIKEEYGDQERIPQIFLQYAEDPKI